MWLTGRERQRQREIETKQNSTLNPQRGKKKPSRSQHDSLSRGEGFTSDNACYRWVSVVDSFYSLKACVLWDLIARFLGRKQHH